MSDMRPVLIAGAGPAGLTAALELSSMGVAVRVVEDKPALRAAGSTLVLHARTLDLLGRRGVSPEVLQDSNEVRAAAVYGNGRLLGTVPVAPDRSGGGHFLLVRQAETELMLAEQLARHGVVIERGVGLAGGTTGTECGAGLDGVRAVLRHRDGHLEQFTASYLISADVRDGTAGQLPGSQAPAMPAGRGWILADLQLDGDVPAEEISIFLGRRGFLAIFPAGGNRFRCVATDASADQAGRGAATAPELQEILTSFSPFPATLREVSWSCRMPAGQHVAPVMRLGRVFFGGDAAHAYLPVSGQGPNSGIQDMLNLSWKLAMVLKGEAAVRLLDTYQQERRQVLHDIAGRAEAAATMLGTQRALTRLLLTRIAPALLDSRFLLRLAADLAGEITPDYRQSPLSAAPHGSSLQPGEPLPDIRVLACDADAPAGTRPREVRLPDLADPSRLTLLFSAMAPAAMPPPAWQDQLKPWQETARAYRIAPAAGDPEEQFRFAQAFGSGQSILIVRPDSYVGFTGSRHAIRRLVTWLSTWFPPEPGH